MSPRPASRRPDQGAFRFAFFYFLLPAALLVLVAYLEQRG